MAKFIFTIKAPSLQTIRNIILGEFRVDSDWYYTHVHTQQPLVIQIKGYISHLAYRYGYTRREIGPYIGSDNGNSVPYYHDKLQTWVNTYQRDRVHFQNITRVLILQETLEVNITVVLPSVSDIFGDCMPVYSGINLKVINLKTDEVEIQDIKWHKKPLRNIHTVIRSVGLEKIGNHKYKVVYARR